MFGRATIRLGIGPHSSLIFITVRSTLYKPIAANSANTYSIIQDSACLLTISPTRLNMRSHGTKVADKHRSLCLHGNIWICRLLILPELQWISLYRFSFTWPMSIEFSRHAIVNIAWHSVFRIRVIRDAGNRFAILALFLSLSSSPVNVANDHWLSFH